MAAPGSLYVESAQLLEGAGNQAMGNAKLDQSKIDTTVQAGEAAGREVGASSRQESAQKAQQKLMQMEMEAKLKGEMITITPQLALGLVKNTGEKDWLKAVGQSMRADIYTSLYTHGMQMEAAKRAPKIIQRANPDGTLQNGLVWTDAEGVQQFWPGTGISPEKLHPSRRGSGEKDPNFKKNQQFIKSFEKARSELADPARAAQLKATNPDSYTEKTQWLKDNQDRYDQLLKGMGAAGGGGASPAPAAGGSASTDSAPFDADAFIKDALGNQ